MSGVMVPLRSYSDFHKVREYEYDSKVPALDFELIGIDLGRTYMAVLVVGRAHCAPFRFMCSILLDLSTFYAFVCVVTASRLLACTKVVQHHDL